MSHALKGDLSTIRDQLKMIIANQHRQEDAILSHAIAVHKLADRIAASERRTEFADVLRGLKRRGIITDADIAKIEAESDADRDAISGLAADRDDGAKEDAYDWE